MNNDGLHYFYVKTRTGNTICFFFNEETNLVVGNLIHKNNKGGCEFLRKKLDEDKLIGWLDNEDYW